MKHFTIILVLLSYGFCFKANAQKDTSASSGKITVFDNETSTTKNHKIKVNNSNTIKNIFKLNPCLFLNGDIPIYYERALNSFMTLEVAPGITYHDFWGDLYNEADVDTFLSLPFEPEERSGIGYSFKIDVKFFPGADNLLDGFYLSPEIGYRHYTDSYVNYDGFGNTTSIYSPGFTNVTDIKLIFGSEEESEDIDNFIKDLYFGLGVRHISAIYYGEGQKGTVYFTQQLTKTTWEPTLYFGFKVGIGTK